MWHNELSLMLHYLQYCLKIQIGQSDSPFRAFRCCTGLTNSEKLSQVVSNKEELFIEIGRSV